MNPDDRFLEAALAEPEVPITAGYVPIERPTPAVSEDRRLFVSEEDIKRLPRWARVAFAVRCARRVLPLAVQDASLSEDYIRAVVAAVEAAEQAAAAADADVFAVRAAVEAIRSPTNVSLPIWISVLAASAAVEAASNLDNPEGSRRTSAQAAIEATVNLLLRVATIQTSEIVTAPARDYDRLARLVQVQHYSYKMPIPLGAFGPMWEGPPPPWWSEDVITASPTRNPDPAPAESGSK